MSPTAVHNKNYICFAPRQFFQTVKDNTESVSIWEQQGEKNVKNNKKKWWDQNEPTKKYASYITNNMNRE